MKKLILIMVISCFASLAEAKVTYNNKPMETGHMNTIKGFLYDTRNNSNEIAISKSIAWLENCHNSEQTFKLEQVKIPEASLIKDTISTIYQVLQGKFPGLEPNRAIDHWNELGSRVLARTSTNAVWKLELRAKPSRTQNLVFKHAPNRIITLPLPQ
jgi:hypothetical protein